MIVPPSPHFTPINLAAVFNVKRATLNGSLSAISDENIGFGSQNFLGMPFQLGQPNEHNVILLDKEPVEIALGGIQANYIIFLHQVEDRVTNYLDDLADFAVDGNELGQHVADYVLGYEDGTEIVTPILRRFAIQQSHIGWGASPFAAVPAKKPSVSRSMSEDQILGQVSGASYGRGETRHGSPRDTMPEKLWLYALPNPHPDKPIHKIVCQPQSERALIYAITHTQVSEHPLRPGVRQKLYVPLPDGVSLNALGELDEVALDLGVVISARAALDYDEAEWLGAKPNVQPTQSQQAVVVEYTAHPQARLYVGADGDKQQVYDLGQLTNTPVKAIESAHRPVKIKVVDKASGQPVAVRLHLHGAFGEYLPPKGYHRRVNVFWFEDNYGEFANGLNQYCYIPGECVADLPLGEVYVEITKGYEVAPIRRKVTVTADTDEMVFELEKVLQWRESGWVTADTHVHFLSPQTALLEGAAEGVNVVNLLASQWGEMFSNVSDFDGKSTLGAKDFGGDGEFLVRVGTENRMQVLGHISLLGYSGAMIHPLCTGGPSESAIGDAQELTMAEWAKQCINQGGLVVLPHGPNPQCERAADIVLGLVHAIEMMTFNPFDAQINPYGLADWYRYLNLGYHVPLVGGSDKMSAGSLLGGVRTYAHLGQREFTYQNWMAAVQAGHTFATVGPLADIQVEGLSPGQTLNLSPTGGTVNVNWQVESVSLPIDQVEIVVGGLAVEQIDTGRALSAQGSTELKIEQSTWAALRVRGSYRGEHGEIAAHTSAIQILVGDKPLFAPKDAMAVLEQIEGAIAYVDTLAPRPEAQRYKQLRATLESAHNQLHQRLHQQGIYHQHTPVHKHEH
jgi:hypothetical protein